MRDVMVPVLLNIVQLRGWGRGGLGTGNYPLVFLPFAEKNL